MDMFRKWRKPNVSKMTQERDVAGLVRAVSYSDPEIRKAAASVLQSLTGEDVTNTLLKALASGDAQSAAVLGARGDERAIPGLIQALSSPELAVHQNASSALLSLRAVDALREAFRKAPEPNARQLALRALQDLAPRDLDKLFVEALEDPTEDVRSLAYFSGVTPRLLDSPNHDLRLSAVRALAWCERPTEEDKLFEALSDEISEIRCAALEGLATIWATSDLATRAARYSEVRPMFKDHSRGVRTSLCTLAGKIGIGTPQLIECLGDADGLVSHQAALSLGTIGGAQAVEALIQHLGTGSWAAARALGRTGDPAAVPALIEALKNLEIAGCAAESLGLLGEPSAIEALEALRARAPKVRRRRVDDGPDLIALVDQALDRLRESESDEPQP